MRKAGTSLEVIYDWDENWQGLADRVDDLLPEDFEWDEDHWPRQLCQFLNEKADWSDDDIWKALIDDCDGRIEQHKKQMAALEKERQRNRQKVDVQEAGLHSLEA